MNILRNPNIQIKSLVFLISLFILIDRATLIIHHPAPEKIVERRLGFIHLPGSLLAHHRYALSLLFRGNVIKHTIHQTHRQSAQIKRGVRWVFCFGVIKERSEIVLITRILIGPVIIRDP